MAIQVTRITGDTVELIFDPRRDHLRIGETLSVLEDQGGQGLIVQIIEFRTLPLAPPLGDPWHFSMEGPAITPPAHVNMPPSAPRGSYVSVLQVAVAKIRRRTDPQWRHWNGWIPGHDAVVAKVTEREVLRHCIHHAGNPLRLGKTLAGEDLRVEGRTLEKISLITGMKGSGTTQMAGIIMRELMACEAPCVVFDVDRTYTRLSGPNGWLVTSTDPRPTIIPLVAGDTLKLSVTPSDLDWLQILLTDFGLPQTAALAFVNHVAPSLARLRHQQGAGQPMPLFGIDDLIKIALDLDPAEGDAMSGALLRCLKAIRHAGVLVTYASEARPLRQYYGQIRTGGAIVIDLTHLTHRAWPGFVRAVIDILQDICDTERTQGSHRFPFAFFDQAHLYFNHQGAGDLIMCARHRGLNSIIITEMIMKLDGTALRQADNLFILRLAGTEDICCLSKSGLIDQESLAAMLPKLPDRHSILVGNTTRAYPIVLAMDDVGSLDAGDESLYFFQRQPTDLPSISLTESADHTTPAPIPETLTGDTTLPLFPEGIPSRSAPPVAPTKQPPPHTSQHLPRISVAQVTQQWQQIVKRLGRRRRILETILSSARPLRIAEHTLVLEFPPQHRFQRELIDSAEYRSLLEEELRNTFRLAFEVTTVLYPTQQPPRRRT